MFIPAIVIIGSAPPYYLIWITWKLFSLILPSWIYQKGDDICYCCYQRFILFFFENLSGMEVIFHGDALDVMRKKERVIYISNHQSTMDWIVVHMLAERQGSLGHVRYVMKDSLQAIPLYGFYFYQHGCIFVKRGKFDGTKMNSALNYLNDDRIPSWLVIFPEGTRFNPASVEILDKSRQFAEEQGLYPYSHLLTPRIRGLQMALDGLRSNLDAIYDVTVIYSNTIDNKGFRIKAPSMFEMITGSCKQLHIHVNRIDISVVPKSNDDLKSWLFTIYQEKDKLLKTYYENSYEAFPTNIKVPIKFVNTFGSFLFMVIISLPFVTTIYGRSIYWKIWLLGSVAGYFWLGLKSVA